MPATIVASTLFMLLLVLLVLYWIRGRRQRESTTLRGTFFQRPTEGDTFAAIEDALASPLAWAVSFFVLVFLALGSVVLFLADVPLGVDMFAVLAGLFAVVLLGFVLVGVYLIGRSRGHSSAASLAESLTVLGLLAILAVLAHLVFVT